jgi:hypothetical protein
VLSWGVHSGGTQRTSRLPLCPALAGGNSGTQAVTGAAGQAAQARTCQQLVMVGTAPSLMAATYASVSPASAGPVSVNAPRRLGCALRRISCRGGAASEGSGLPLGKLEGPGRGSSSPAYVARAAPRNPLQRRTRPPAGPHLQQPRDARAELGPQLLGRDAVERHQRPLLVHRSHQRGAVPLGRGGARGAVSACGEPLGGIHPLPCVMRATHHHHRHPPTCPGTGPGWTRGSRSWRPPTARRPAPASAPTPGTRAR